MALLQSEREQARVLEQRLDQLVPRLLARMAEADERRAQAARVLAELTGRSRSLRLAPTMRARMLALGPVMLERLRSIEDRVLSLRGDRDRIIEHHAKTEHSLAELTAEQKRVEQERAQKRFVQQAALKRLRTVEAEMRLLNEEQARLARSFLREDAVMVARAEPRAEPRALAYPGGMRGASGWGATIDKRSAGRTTLVGGWQRTDARVVAAVPGPGSAGGATALPGGRARAWRAAGQSIHPRAWRARHPGRTYRARRSARRPHSMWRSRPVTDRCQRMLRGCAGRRQDRRS